ncbi:hypothetical protein QUC31_007371 [Theobroma cacao]|uniref:Uncharacterized protein LOC18507041 n=2 Tax=Theobroma cacao TaxID=3641 RepID=A0AB32W029_THECC|nr:PREDICTED: uncharacterized protein LOC18507041 [Theobroma cacao]EOY20289.1 Dynein light chain type 1 family protein, putative isoform 2 [Theobroma cacao]WRX11907.1 Dynein light chain [Theobroma cacao]
MAHRTTNRRILAAPEPNPSSHSIDPTLRGLPNPTITSHPTTQKSDPLIPPKKPFFMTNHFSRLNLHHKTRTPHKPTNDHHNHAPPQPSRDIHLQAKAMTVSADAADPSKFSLIKANYLPLKTAKESLKEKVRKASKDLDKKREQHHQRSVLDSKKVDLTVKEKQVKNLHDVKKASASLGRRRSFCGSQVELADILANCGVKIVSVDMPPFMQIHAVDCARKTHDSLEKFTSKTLALTLKKEFDGVYGPAWHCIVGTSFGSFVTHSVGGFLYFSMDQKLYVLLFKTTVQRAD